MDEQSKPTPPPAVPMAQVPMTAAAPKKSRWWLWLLLGGGGVVGLVILCAGGFAWFLMSGKAKIEPVVDAFQAKVDAGNYKTAYQSVGPEWKSIDTQAGFTNLEKVIRDHLGNLQSKSMTGININDGTNGGIATISYSASYQKGPADVTYTLSNSTGSWLVIGHNVNSPVLTKLMTCPKCGAVSNTWSEFCSKCGAKMNH